MNSVRMTTSCEFCYIPDLLINFKVLNKFKAAWKFPTTPLPTIKRVFKIIESANFLLPYDNYKYVQVMSTL